MGWPYCCKSKRRIKTNCVTQPLTLETKQNITNENNKSATTQNCEGEAEWLGWLEGSKEKVRTEKILESKGEGILE